MSVTALPGSEWQEPVPLDEAIAPPPFPTEELPLWLRNFVRAQAESSQVPEDLTGMLALATISAALQGRVSAILNNATWTEPITLYVAVALPPGERKSSVFDRMTAPLTEWEYQTQMAEYPQVAESQQELKELEKTVDKIDEAVQKQAAKVREMRRSHEFPPDEIRKAEGDLDTLRKEGVDARVQLQEHETRYPMRLIYNDLTPEACAQALSQQKFERLAIMSDEGGVFDVLSGGRYADKLNLDVFLKGHSGNRIQIDRVGRDSETIMRPMLTLGLAVQPSVLREIGKSKQMHGRGLLGRFAYSIPTTSIGRRIIDPPNVSDAVRDAYQTAITAIAQSAYAQTEVARVFLSDEADADFMGYQQALEPRLGEFFEGEGGLHLIGDWANKLAGLVARTATIIAAAREQRIPEVIEAVDMRAAIQFGPYFEAHARMAFSMMGVTPNSGLEEKIIRKIRGMGWLDFKTRDLQHKLAITRDYTSAELEEVLDGLARMGYLRRITESVKPPRWHWAVNPAVHEETP